MKDLPAPANRSKVDVFDRAFSLKSRAGMRATKEEGSPALSIKTGPLL